VFGVLVGMGLGKIANIFAAGHLPGVTGSTNIISVPPWLGLSVIAATTIIGMLAGMWPAFRAAKMNPVEALRYE
jgi:putative ABC transport system permease protein